MADKCCICGTELFGTFCLRCSGGVAPGSNTTPHCSCDGHLERRVSEPDDGRVSHLVVIVREQTPEVTQFTSLQDARDYFETASLQWSESFLVSVVVGPGRPPVDSVSPTRLQLERRMAELEEALREFLRIHSTDFRTLQSLGDALEAAYDRARKLVGRDSTDALRALKPEVDD